MRRWAAAFAAIALAASVFFAGASGAAATTAPAQSVSMAISSLTAIGNAAVDDLRTCLASNRALNVYYLIDNSRSLSIDDDGSKGSDPDKKRAGILGNSLDQLKSLGDDFDIHWGAGFFSTAFAPATDGWRALTEKSGAQLSSMIKKKVPSGYTDWLEGFQGVQKVLASQPQPDKGTACQLVVWFTDGAIDLPGGAKDTADALNDLCGQRIDPRGHAPQQGYGILNSFRQSHVVVLGTLLASGSTRSDADVMWPLVEGTGKVDGRTATCGQPDPPEGAYHGAVVDASDPEALARVFLELAARIGGGTAVDDDEFRTAGTFWIDPGVARFVAIPSGDWTLTPPKGSGLEPVTSATTPSWAEVDSSSGATSITVRTTEAKFHGQWKLTPVGSGSVNRFSDLTVRFPDTNKISIDENGVAEATVEAHVETTGGEATGLDDFAAPGVIVGYFAGETFKTVDGSLDPKTGAITFPLPSTLTAAQVVVQASIKPLTTKAHSIELDPITAQQTIATSLPAEFPSIMESPVRLTNLDGSNGEAKGQIMIAAPASGGAGQVCVDSEPRVVSDAADRGESWHWTWNGGSSRTCVPVEAGGTASIPLTATNPVAADSTAQATVRVELVSAGDNTITQDVPIVFQTTHPIDTWRVALIALILMLLGILLPLIGLWLVNWWTTRLDIDPQIQRAAFPVRIGSDGVEFPDLPASDTALSSSFGYRGEQRNVRVLTDPDLGRLRARVPWFPLLPPDYVIVPHTGAVVAAARTSARATSAGERMPGGSMRFRQLPLERFWAVVVSRAELQRTARGDDVRGTAVVYHRMETSQTQYRERIDDIRLEGDTLAERVDRLRADLARADAAKAARGADSSRPGAPAPPASVPAGSTASTPPPRPGASGGAGNATPPPRTGIPPRTSSGAPPRTGEPPGATGGTAPPPRPSAPPPPPRGS